MIAAVDLSLPAWRACRSRRMMFSTSTIASSTTTPTAISEPRQHHRVEGRPAQVEHQCAGHQRQRDRDQADQRRAPVEQEGAERQHQQHSSR